MEEAIYLFAGMVYGSTYATLLKDDLKEYSDKEKREALQSLKEQARERALSFSQKQWLLANTAC